MPVTSSSFDVCGAANFRCMNCTDNPICTGVVPLDLQRMLLQVCTAADIQNRAVRRVYLGYTSETCALAQRMSQLQQGAQIVNGVVCCATNGCNRPNTTGSSPTPVVSKYLIQLVLSMALSRAQFPDMLRERFREQIAVTAGLAVAEAGRVALVFSDAPSRRLLAGMLINATVNMPNASSVAAAAARLTEAALNSNLMAAGLPSVRILSQTTTLPTATGASCELVHWSSLVLLLSSLVVAATTASMRAV
jgi:hypothetical protein